MTTTSNLDVALKYAAFGVAIFPCGSDKRPLIDNWLASASTDPQTIRRWWREHPHALIGLPLKPLDLWVLDADRHHADKDGVKHLQTLCAEHTQFLPHPWCTTANHGEHHYFKQPAVEKIGNKKIGGGLETRGFKPDNDGGYVIASGSRMQDGRKWQRGDNSPSLLESYRAGVIPTPPSWLINLLLPHPRAQPSAAVARRHTNGSREAAYASKALDGGAAVLASAGPGTRNDTLNAAAFRMGTMIVRGWIDRAEVSDALTAACLTNGLVRDNGFDTVQATLASGLRAGEEKPHQDLGDRSNRQPAVKATKVEKPITSSDMVDDTDVPAVAPQFTEEALALHFADRYAGNLCYVAAWSRWMRWNGKHWPADDTLFAFDLSRKSAGNSPICLRRLRPGSPPQRLLPAWSPSQEPIAALPQPLTNGTPIRGCSIRRAVSLTCEPAKCGRRGRQTT
jgi:Bifunctional DNA primase/polymerase, N-terminal/D5 N terminal like